MKSAMFETTFNSRLAYFFPAFNQKQASNTVVDLAKAVAEAVASISDIKWSMQTLR